jgi:hypothetical protein
MALYILAPPHCVPHVDALQTLFYMALGCQCFGVFVDFAVVSFRFSTGVDNFASSEGFEDLAFGLD